MIEFYQIIANSFVLVMLLLSIIFAFGIVWRVEKELDISYKLILGAIVAFTIGEILELFDLAGGIYLYILTMFLKIVFSGLLLAGILTMRNVLREMDGEK